MSGSFWQAQRVMYHHTNSSLCWFGKPFKLHTDMSVLGLGAILYKEQDGVERVISYASQSLSKSEFKYPIHKLEFLCLKWTITDQFMNICIETPLMSIQITIPWHMFWLLPIGCSGA